MIVTHEFPPFYDESSQILILGSFPSVKSREQGFYYGHPQNRFWDVLATVFGKTLPKTVGEKKLFLKECGIALYDSIYSCEIKGSSDSSIRNAVGTDILPILKNSVIKAIFANGKLAYGYYEKLCFPDTKLHSVCLPSTSPANAAWTREKLIAEYSVILNFYRTV